MSNGEIDQVIMLHHREERNQEVGALRVTEVPNKVILAMIVVLDGIANEVVVADLALKRIVIKR